MNKYKKTNFPAYILGMLSAAVFMLWQTPGIAYVSQSLPAAAEKLLTSSASQDSILTAENVKELVIIDTGVVDGRQLSQQLRPGVEVVFLNDKKSGIEQITAILAQRQNLDAVHLISHGAPGELVLNGRALTAQNINQYQSSIQQWGRAFSKGGDLLLYACSLAGDGRGHDLISRLADLTGIDVAASDDITAPVKDGGDLELEHAMGEIETASVINDDTNFLPLFTQTHTWPGWPAGSVGPFDYVYPDLVTAGGANVDVTMRVDVTGSTARYILGTPDINNGKWLHAVNYASLAENININVEFHSCVSLAAGADCTPAFDATSLIGVYFNDLTVTDIDSRDSNGFQDQLVFSAVTVAGASIEPDTIQLQAGSTLTVPPPTGGSIRADTVYAQIGLQLPDTDTRGFATKMYTTDLVTQFSILYQNGPDPSVPANPAQQGVWITDFTFSDEIIATQAVITRVDAKTSSGGTVLEWETGSEVGTAGFYVKRYDEAKKRFVRIHKGMIPSVGAPQGGTYRVIDPTAVSGETYRYKLVEREYRGKKNRYGPYEVTVDGEGFGRENPEGEKPPVPVGVASSSLEHRSSKAEREKSHANHEARKAARKAKHKNHKGSALKLGVQEAGLYFVSSAEMASAFGIPERRVKRQLRRARLMMTNQGEKVAWHAAEDNSGLYFYGEAIDSPFTLDNVYWIKRGKGLQMAETENDAPLVVTGQSFLDEVSFEEDKQAWTVITSDPDSDYWYWNFVFAGSSSSSAEFNLPVSAVADSNATMLVHLKGVEITGLGNAYSVDIALNGTTVGSESWTGTELKSFEFPVSLLDGTNQVTVTGVTTAGADFTYVLIDSIDLRYRRRYEAQNGALALRGDGNDVVTVSGVDGASTRILDISNPKQPLWLGNFTADVSTSSFTPRDGQRNYLVADNNGIKTPVWLVADAHTDYRKYGIDADYLVITPTEWVVAAQALADLRTGSGLKTAVVALDDIYDEMSYGIASPNAIKDFLARMYRKGHKRLKYVVLLGEGSMDYRDLLGNGDSIVPPLMAPTPDGLFAADTTFGNVKGSAAPEMIVARIPVESVQEIADYVAKLAAHEGSALDKVLIVADAKDPGAGIFSVDADVIADMLPDAVPSERLYAQTDSPYTPPFYSVAETGTRLRASFAEGLGLIDYTGHGSVISLSSGLLRTSDVAGLGNAGKYPVLFALTCVVNRFDLSGIDSLGEQLVLSPQSGAIAVVAPSGLSLNAGAQTLNKALIRAMYGHGDTILGDAFLRALGEYVDSGEYLSAIYNLVGDPYVTLTLTQTDSRLITTSSSPDRKKARKKRKERHDQYNNQNQIL